MKNTSTKLRSKERRAFSFASGCLVAGCVLVLVGGMVLGRELSVSDSERRSAKEASAMDTGAGNAHVSRKPEHDRMIKRVVFLLLTYVAMAYAIVPVGWKHYIRGRPLLEGAGQITHTADGIRGDPLNIALIGTEESIQRIMLAAEWRPADPITLASCLRIATATLTRRSYEDAPVSNLYLWGRKQDFAFEQPVGQSPRRRHHVRFWRSEKTDPAGRPVWLGAATYDRKVGFSHLTGQITHHIEADIDTERNGLFEALRRTGKVTAMFVVNSFHKKRRGRNGGGDPWYTDGRLFVAVVDSEQQAH